MVVLTQVVGEPVIGAGVDDMFSESVIKQPVGITYVITDVPAATPVTIPPLVIVAMFVEPLLQVPPPVTSVKVAVDPIQYTEVWPDIGAGNGLTVAVITAVQPLGAV